LQTENAESSVFRSRIDEVPNGLGLRFLAALMSFARQQQESDIQDDEPGCFPGRIRQMTDVRMDDRQQPVRRHSLAWGEALAWNRMSQGDDSAS